MELTIDPSFEPLRQMLAWLGREKLRPLGIEADQLGRPVPATHPFFREVLELGLTGGFAGRLDNETVRASSSESKPRKAARRAVVLAEEVAYWDRGMATSLPGPGLGGPPVVFMGSEEQKKKYLGIFQDRTTPHWGAFAMSEPGAGSDVARIRTVARRDGDSYVISGEKMFISNGARASWVVVWATVDPALGRAGHRAFIVEKDTPGFQVAKIEKKMGLCAAETASLVFDECRVPASCMLGQEKERQGPEGFKGAMRTFDMTRPMVAAMAIGIGRAAYDEACRFAREAFAGPSRHRLQKARERLAQIRRKLEAGRLLAWRAAWLADLQKTNSVEAAMAKAYCAPVGLEAASLGLDILAEAGGSSDYLIEKLFRDVKVLDIVEGTGQIQRIVIAKRLIGYADAAGEQLAQR